MGIIPEKTRGERRSVLRGISKAGARGVQLAEKGIESWGETVLGGCAGDLKKVHSPRKNARQVSVMGSMHWKGLRRIQIIEHRTPSVEMQK